jgi:hypothetical protein
MSIRKILRFYLVFTLIITAAAGLSYNKNINGEFTRYYASVVHSLDQITNNGDFKYLDQNSFNYASILNIDPVRKYSNKNNNHNLVNFKIEQDIEKSYAEKGDKGIEIMKFILNTATEKLNFNYLKFKITGIEAKSLDNIYIFDGKEQISKGIIHDEYIEFKYINFKLDTNSTAELYIKVDLNDSLKAGDRMRLDIEAPEDISILVGAKRYLINEYYPIKGKYMTVIKINN